MVAYTMGFYSILLTIEYLQVRPGFKIDYELFVFVLFGILLSWLAFFGGFVSDLRQRLSEQNKRIQKVNEEINLDSNSSS